MALFGVTGPLTRFALALLGSGEDGVDGSTGAQLRRPRYETLLDVAAANLRVGTGVVLAAPFTEERSSLERWRALADRLRQQSDTDEPVALLYLDVPAEILDARLEARNAPRDRGKLVTASARATHEPVIAEAIVLDGTGTITDQVTAALAAITSRSAAPRGESVVASC